MQKKLSTMISDEQKQRQVIEKQSQDFEQQKVSLELQIALCSLLEKAHALLRQKGEVIDEDDPDMRLLSTNFSGGIEIKMQPKKTKEGIRIEFVAKKTHIHRETWDDPHDYRWAVPPIYPVLDADLQSTYRPISKQKHVIVEAFSSSVLKDVQDLLAFAKEVESKMQ